MTSKRVIVALVSIWITSGVIALVAILLPETNSIVLVGGIIKCIGLLLTTIAYNYSYLPYHEEYLVYQAQISREG